MALADEVSKLCHVRTHTVLPCAPHPTPLQALTALMALAPKTALLVELDEEGNVVASQEVATALIHKGDILKVGAARVAGAARVVGCTGMGRWWGTRH